MIEVYQINDELFVNENVQNWDLVDKRFLDTQFSMAEDRQEKAAISLFNEGAYVLVAKVDTNCLEEAFEKTNHINESWFKNKEVEPLVDKARSSKVGDIFKDDDGKFHIVASLGFRELENHSINPPKNKNKNKL